jgi:phospholipid/cholesterol/gamma-HCH transport system ATP-binding protein
VFGFRLTRTRITSETRPSALRREELSSFESRQTAGENQKMTTASRECQLAAIELRHASRSFGGQAVLRDVSLEVRRGETLVLIGESGCGKSVTTKLLAGLLEPSFGDVLWDGRPVQGRPEKEKRRDRLRLGYLFQGAALFDSMDVFENIAFGLRENTTLTELQIQQIVHERLREVGLKDNVVSRRPSDLSGGMKKRVGLARALAMSPEIVFYDEPTTGLDPIMSGVINDLIVQTQSRRNVTSVVVTHDMNTVRQVADRVIMLFPLNALAADESQVVFEGSCHEVFETENPRVSQFVRGEVRTRLMSRSDES